MIVPSKLPVRLKSPVPPLDLPAGTVDVWSIELAVGAGLEALYASDLSLEERERAKRFLRREFSRRFVVSHGAVRRILAGYVAVPPAALVFGAGANGKPYLLNEEGKGLLFNLSHSSELAVLAVSRDVPLGVDVERLQADTDTPSIAWEYMSELERRAWSALNESRRLPAFFKVWVRKEAYVKGLGIGMSYPSTEYSVILGAEGEPERVEDARDPEEGRHWRLRELAVGDHYEGALAVRSGADSPKVNEWSYVHP